jgi:hypothetical protein
MGNPQPDVQSMDMVKGTRSDAMVKVMDLVMINRDLVCDV